MHSKIFIAPIVLFIVSPYTPYRINSVSVKIKAIWDN